ncbi:cysteine proteinase [Leucogyrophana mollusca]|uniref:Cysteine proteinase n=1 Tax=Leucogyrophana mollusca TaxID=85980 RepID=A0ACB8BJ66_9AGAM|nr:cysteine proteinase [Leucogyrophana mollusca]
MSSRWIPLESNPEVLNKWANAAGLVETQYQFCDVYGLDSELLALVLRPVKAVVLLFPVVGAIAAKRKEEDAEIAAKGQHPVDPTVMWIKQTISNACGTMGLLHALCNTDVTLAPESPLEKFIEECQDKTPLERAKILETTPLFAKIHEEGASSGQTAVPSDLDTDLHFTCFVQAPDASARATETPTTTRRMIELDGSREGPIDRGESKDLLEDVAKFVKEYYVAQASSMQFSMLALCPPDI